MTGKLVPFGIWNHTNICKSLVEDEAEPQNDWRFKNAAGHL